MNESYKKSIQQLIASAPFEIDTEIQIGGPPPTMASSQFLTNKEQGDWAEEIIFNAINKNSKEYRAVKSGRADSIAAGDPHFPEFYAAYQGELNSIGKKPDLLVFRRFDIPKIDKCDLGDDNFVQKAIAAIEVRSSSFLANKYSVFMKNRTRNAENECHRIQQLLLQEPYADVLREKASQIYKLLSNATIDTFRELDFKSRSWSSSQVLRDTSQHLKNLKAQIKILHKRDYLSVTPKLEDISLVNRWIQRFGIPHYYLQVFFDKAYVIPFIDILKITSDPKNEGEIFSVEQDVKNQQKTTLKINVMAGKEILGRIDMPEHQSVLRELERGRLLFYVKFRGGRGYLDPNVFMEEIVNGS